ncbi:sigma-54 dependent transcriptional regulator [Luteibacter sp. PPL201]|uniref:Sigma-54 dependent transcriptional regulator n=1 Tax=Luteibacter sahnii TaxID=3021977 RepID=A0ABT6BC37_9GAMM
MARILIIDDDADFRDTLASTLESMGHDVDVVGDGHEGLVALEQADVDLAFLDYLMPGRDGLSVLRTLGERGAPPKIPIIMLTAHATGENTIAAMRYGAFDHLTKPIGRDDLAAVIARARQAKAPPAPTPAAAPDGVESEPLLVGVSDAMRAVQKTVGMAAATSVPVLIHGETGTGKDVVARALHRASARAAMPFIAVNCAAIPAELMESELFGHRKGAFTGAVAERKGHFREAEGGTLFLDEIGDMPAAMQAKLLRVLQEQEVVPVGASQPVRVDVRVVAASHRDLAQRVADGQFRADLLYRLDVLSVRIAPLRDRREDIEPLVRHFLAGRKRIAADALAALCAYPWPGNVRQLRNAIERGVALSRTEMLTVHDLAAILPEHAAPEDVRDAPDGTTLPEAVEALERRMIRDALDVAQGNRAEAARRLGIRRQLLYRKMADYGLE